MNLNQSRFKLKCQSKCTKDDQCHDIANPKSTDPLEDPDINALVKDLINRMKKMTKGEITEDVNDICKKI